MTVIVNKTEKKVTISVSKGVSSAQVAALISVEASARSAADTSLSTQITALGNRLSILESTPPTLSFPSIAAREKGTSYAPAISGTVTLNDGTITEVRVKRGSTVLNTSSSANISYTAPAISTSATYTIEVDYSLPGGGSGMLTSSQTVSFYAPSYHGSGAAGLNETQIKSLTKALRSSRAASNLNYNLSANRPYYVYPKSYGSIVSVTDQNGYNVTAGFTVTELTFTLADNSTEDMYVVMGNDNVTATNFKYSFA